MKKMMRKIKSLTKNAGKMHLDAVTFMDSAAGQNRVL